MVVASARAELDAAVVAAELDGGRESAGRAGLDAAVVAPSWTVIASAPAELDAAV
jgi:hypothetical protein